jgi:hypothetical protein
MREDERSRKRCLIAYALPEHQLLWNVEIDSGATIEDALAAARHQAGEVEVPWDTAEVGVFGEILPRTTVPHDGDRIEIYRPLAADPRESRRERVQRARRERRRS